MPGTTVTGPDPAVAEVRRAVRETLRAVAVPGDRVLVACSGGADSLALAAATAFEADRLGLLAGSVTVDHGLQQGSDRVAAEAAATAAGLGLAPAVVRRVRVTAGGGPEAAARRARYTALREAAAAEGAAWVLLGHTLDDQAETVLLGLGRGSGPRSIAGMRQVDRPWLRPLLTVPRATTAAACRAEGRTPWEDPHNADPRYTRVRLRREVLPLLEDVLGGGVAAALARTAGLLRDDLDALDGQAERIRARLAAPDHQRPTRAADSTDARTPADIGIGAADTDTAETAADTHIDTDTDTATVDSAGAARLDAVALAGLPPALRGRVIRSWLRSAGVPAVTSVHLGAVDALATGWRGQGPVALPGAWAAHRTGTHLCLTPP